MPWNHFAGSFCGFSARIHRKTKESETICYQTLHKLDCFVRTTSQMTNLTWHHLSLDVIMFNFTLSSFFGVSCTGKLFVTQKTKLFVILYLLFSVNSHGASTAYTSPYHKLGLNVESERNKSFITRDLSNVTIFQLIFPKKSDETRTNIFEWQCRRRMEATRNKLLLVSDCNLWMKHSKSQQIQRIACCLKFSF